jgi:hypothetical protein
MGSSVDMKRLDRGAAVAAMVILLMGIFMLMTGIGVISLSPRFREDFPTDLLTLASFLWIGVALLILRSVWRSRKRGY